MKKLLLLFVALIGIGFSVNAQVTNPINEATYKTNGFSYAKEFWMCSSYTKNINMAFEAFGVSVSSQGKWYELRPGAYTDATTDFTSSLLKTMPVDNIFNVDGRGAGIYEFLFVNEAAGFCDMPLNAKAIFRVYVVPDLTGFSVKTVICQGSTTTVDFTLNVPSVVKDFANQMGWSFVIKDGASIVAMPLTVSSPGIKNYTYEINDASGNFAGRYAALTTSAYSCASTAKISHSVEHSTNVITPPAAIQNTYCLSNLMQTHPTNYLVDLASVLNFSAPNGQWSVVSDGGATVTVAAATGAADILLTGRTAPSTVIFAYSFTGCDGASTPSSVNVTFVFGNTELTSEISNKSVVKCRNFATGDVSLLDILGISVPSTAGTWSEILSGATNTIPSGTVDFSTLQTGKDYTYRYNVSPAAVSELCQVTSYEATLTLKIDDVNGLNSGQAQICKNLYDGGAATVNLSDYIAGLPSTGVQWYTWNGTLIASPSTYAINATNFNVGTNLFKFVYTSTCGQAEGNLYLTVTDRMTNFTNKTIRFCYTDAEAQSIDLFQKLGIVGLQGSWTSTSVTTNLSTSGVFSGTAQYEADGGSAAGDKTYIFEYDSPGEGCINAGEKATITVIITPDIVAP